MKTLLLTLLLLLPTLTLTHGERIVIIPEKKPETPAPLFFSATASVTATASTTEVRSTQDITFTIHQGTPDILTLPLTGPGTIEEITGENLRDWSVRITENGTRFLDVRPLILDEKTPPTSLTIQLKTSLLQASPTSLLLPTPGTTTGFSLTLQLDPTPGTDLRITQAPGFLPLESGATRKYTTTTTASLQFSTTPAGTASNGLLLLDSSLTATLSEDTHSATFTLTATLRADAPGASAQLLSGNVALTSDPSGENHHIALAPDSSYTLIADTAGDFPISVEFIAPITRRGDWSQLSFKLPAGIVVPLTLTGLPQSTTFDPSLPVVPRHHTGTHRGFLPASGQATLAWKNSTTTQTGSLFYTSTATTDIRIGSGLTRQVTTLSLRILQGKLPSLTLDLTGPGEILSITSPSILAWSLTGENNNRKIHLKLSRPIQGTEDITIEAQTPLSAFPVKMQALRITPPGSLRHSGHLRIANDGAVRIELASAKGLIQLTPEQFPGPKDDTLRQVFVYRFPSADFSYQLLADQILPEVSLTEVTVYELAQTDRRIISDIELDIRQAPLREWEMQIPADHAVASLTGTEIADYTLASEEKNNLRTLKIIFRQPVINRQLISLRLEKNHPAEAAPWPLTPLSFPATKSHRGYLGATATAGYRLTPAQTTGLTEVPTTFFPRTTPGLQQAFRIRQTPWAATLNIEALGQSIQADVFHLYSLKAGAAYGSVLINYFVVGAPANEWQISVPPTIGNIDITGQNIGRDWRREGDTVIVPLTRPILGSGTLLLTFEQPMPSSGGQLSPGEVRPLSVQAERGYIQIVSPLQVKFSAPSSTGPLLKIDPTELPAEFRLLSSAPTLAAWQYTARDFHIDANIQWYQPGETVDQVIDFLKLSSQISRDGQWVTDARFFVKSKGRATLRATLPPGTSLWEASVDHTPVNARADGKETLIPLPSTTDPNQTVEISLRYGAHSKNPSKPTLTAPALDAPLVIGEWTLTGDENRILLPRTSSGGNLRTSAPLPPTGWQYLSRHPLPTLLLILLGTALLLRSSLPPLIAHTAPPILLITALLLGSHSIPTSTLTPHTLEYTAPVISSAQAITLEISNLTPFQAHTGPAVWLLLTLAATSTLLGIMKKHPVLKSTGIALLAASLLTIRGGTPLFLFTLALITLTTIPWRTLLTLIKRPKPTAATAILLLTLLPIYQAKAQDFKPAQSITQTWLIKENRLQATIDITLRAQKGDRFLLLKSPATLTSFKGENLTPSKTHLHHTDTYFLTAQATGLLTATATYEQPLPTTEPWHIPTGPAAIRHITLTYDQPGYEFIADSAAKITPLKAPTGHSAATLILSPTAHPTITPRPTQRDISSEETKFFTEVSNLFLPSPGVVTGHHHITIRPSQGRLSELLLDIPTGFTVSEIANGPIGTWRFDPEKQQLRIPIEPAQSTPFTLTLTTQQSTKTLPTDLTLAPIRIKAAAGEIGFLALAFGSEAQPETLTPTQLTPINPQDFDQTLLPENTLLQHAYRYGKAPASLQVRVTEVAPELRAESWQLLSLSDDRLTLSTDLSVDITRSGIFKLTLEIPTHLELETATGESLSHWTESTENGKRLITLHLTGKTLGKHHFTLTLTGQPPGTTPDWQAPRITLQNASRQTGLLTIVPDRGLQVRAITRKNISQIDPRELTSAQRPATRAAARPGALAYRLLQADWALTLAISKLDPWVTAKILHETTLREGQTLTRAAITYRIENAALKALRIRIPHLDETAAATLRATGDTVADLIPIPSEPGLYEIRFQRGIAGETQVEIEFQQATQDTTTATISPIILEDVRQLQYFAAIRAGGRLSLSTAEIPRGWQRTDWAIAQATIGQPAGTTAPLLLFRVADAQGPLTIAIERHELQNLEKLRVSQGTLTTLISPTGHSLTAVALEMQVTAKTTLRLKLPPESELFNVLVNEEGATLVREKGEWLFYVFPSPEPGKPANVRFVYSEKSEDTTLQGPVLNVPMENLSWRVLIPEGFQLASHEGDFDLSEQSSYGSFNLEDYKSLAQSKKQTDAASAMALLDQANSWLAQGDQEKASQLLSNAYNSNQLDAASGEDARVQLRELKTQQAVLGLNTRRQKLAIDNRAAGQDENTQLEQAANANPILKGDSNYDPTQFNRFLEGNSAEEISALKEIANRIVTQQLAAEPAPLALDITLPERGQVLTFTRSVQVESQSQAPMHISLDLEKSQKSTSWLAIPLCLLIGALAAKRK